MKPRRAILGSAIFVSCFLFINNVYAAGEVIITEIAASPAAGYEWLEIYNRSAEEINLDGWKFFEDATNHGLALARGSNILAASSFAVIAQDANKFSAAYPSYTGTIFDSAWSSLKESGEEIGLKNAQGTFVERFTYISAPNRFLQRKDPMLDDYGSQNWIETSATPGRNFDEQKDMPPISPPPPTPLGPRFSYSWGVVWLNEIVSNPSFGENEWIELKSNSINNIELQGWRIKDSSGVYTHLSGTLPAYGYYVIEKPKGNLNDRGDRVTLIDPDGNIIDELTYGEFDKPPFFKHPLAPLEGASLARERETSSSGSNINDFVITWNPSKGLTNVIVKNRPLKNVAVAGIAPSSTHIAASTTTMPALIPALAVTSTASAPLMSRTSIVEGVVIVAPGVFSSQYFYIQKGRHGFKIYHHKGLFPQLSIGDYVKVQGELDVVNLEARVKIKKMSDVKVVSVDLGKAAINSHYENVEDIGSSMLGHLVRTQGTVTERRKGYMFLDNGKAEVRINIKPKTNIDTKQFPVGAQIALTGVVLPYKGNKVQLAPPDSRDIQLIALPQKPGALKNRKAGIRAAHAYSFATSTEQLLLDKIDEQPFIPQETSAVKYLIVTAAGIASAIAGSIIRRI